MKNFLRTFRVVFDRTGLLLICSFGALVDGLPGSSAKRRRDRRLGTAASHGAADGLGVGVSAVSDGPGVREGGLRRGRGRFRV